MKVEKMIEYLYTINDDIVCYSDGWDAWVRKPEEEIQRRFKCFNSDIVIAGNTDCYPDASLRDKFPNAGRYRFLCAGQFIGYRKSIIGALEAISNYTETPDDQEGWQQVFVNGWADVIIDTDCYVFHTMTNASLDEIKDPCFLHFAGPKGNSPNAKMMENCYSKYLENRK